MTISENCLDDRQLLLWVISGSRWGRKARSALPRSTGMPGHYLPIRDMIALSMTWLYRPSFSRVSVNQRTPMATQVAPIALMRSPVLTVAPEAMLRQVAYTCLTAAGFQRSRQEGWTSYLRNIPPIAPPIAPIGPPIPRGWWARRSVRTRLGRLVSGGEVGSAEATASRGVALSPAWAALALAKAPKTATVRIKARMACFS